MFTRNSKLHIDLRIKLKIFSWVLIVLAVILNIFPIILGHMRFELYPERLNYNLGRELFPPTILFLLSINAPYLLSALVLICVNILYFCYSAYDFIAILPLLSKKTFEHEYYNYLGFLALSVLVILFAIIYLGIHFLVNKMKSTS